MRSMVLLSGGIDPVSGRPAPPRGEIAAIGLALSVDGTVDGLHAGLPSAALRQAAGHGLERIACLQGAGDSVAILAAHLSCASPDLVLAGSLACGGEDSGMLPYLLAERLGWPLLSGVVAIGAVADGWLSVTIGLPLGARQEARIRLPCILCAHDAASAPPFVFDWARRVVLETRDVSVSDTSLAVPPEGTERPYRARPRLIGSATPSSGGTVLDNPDPAEAARVLLAHLRTLGMLES